MIKTKKSTLKIETPKIKDLQNELENAYRLANAWQKTAAKIGEDFLKLQKELEFVKFDSLRLDWIESKLPNVGDKITRDWVDGSLRDAIDTAKENEQPPPPSLIT